jgi:tetratricopeptide (TPR) repeat protein
METHTPPPRGLRPSLRAALLVLATVIAYVPAMRGGFVWDDDLYIVENRLLEEPSGLARIWTGREIHQYYPLTFTTFWIERRLWGLDPLGYHAVNVALHAGSAVVIGGILSRLAVPGSWFVAALFALHPVHVESVAWVMERKNVLSGLFYLLAMACYLRFADRGRWPWYAAALALFGAALLSKTVTATFAIGVFLVLWYRARRVPWRALPALLPFLIVGVGFGAITARMEVVSVGAQGADFDLGPLERVLLAARSFLFYPTKLLLPIDLTFVYPRWTIDASSVRAYLPVLGVGAIVAAAVGLFRRLGPGPLVAVAFYGVAIFPALGFFNVYPFIFSYVADHFQYLASLGILVLIPAAAGAAGRWAWRDDRVRRRAARVVGGAVLVVLAGLTWRQGGIYRDEETLWRDTLGKNPDAWLAHNNLGVIVAEQGQRAEAISHYRRAIAIYPHYSGAHSNLANALVADGELDAAIASYREAVRLDAENASAQHVLALMLTDRGELTEALSHFEQAVAASPGEVAPRAHMAEVLVALGQHERAVREYEGAVALDPDDLPTRYNLAIELATVGRSEEAIAQYRAILERDPTHADAHNNLAAALASRGQVRGALVHYARALAVAPADEDVRVNLASLLVRLGRTDRAVDVLREGLEHAPRSTPLRNALAWHLATAAAPGIRDGEEAVRLASAASAAVGGRDANLLDTLAAAYAEAGRFDEAAGVARQARARALADGDARLAAEVEARLAAYEAGRPHREPAADDPRRGSR